MHYITSSTVQTHIVANKILKSYLKNNKVLFFLLYGNLGSGKTEFVKGIAKGLGFNERQIKSPTFVYVTEIINKKNKLFHIDFYRIEKKFVRDIIYDLIENIDLEKRNQVFCFEWANKISFKTESLLRNIKNSKIVKINLKIVSSSKREIIVNES